MSSNQRKLVIRQLNERSHDNELSLEDEINKHLFRSQTPSEPDGRIHPSSLGRCMRQLFFHMNKVPYTDWTPVPPKLQMTFDQGKSVEMMLFKRYFREMNWTVAEEQKIPQNNHRVSGRCDVILWAKNKYWVVDIKTANDNSFNYGAPYDSYDMQVAAYMIFLQIDQGKVLYYNKDSSELLETKIKITDPIVHRTRERILEANRNFEEGIMPDVTNIRPNCTKESCSYFTECGKYPLTKAKLSDFVVK